MRPASIFYLIQLSNSRDPGGHRGSRGHHKGGRHRGRKGGCGGQDQRKHRQGDLCAEEDHQPGCKINIRRFLGVWFTGSLFFTKKSEISEEKYIFMLDSEIIMCYNLLAIILKYLYERCVSSWKTIRSIS